MYDRWTKESVRDDVHKWFKKHHKAYKEFQKTVQDSLIPEFEPKNSYEPTSNVWGTSNKLY